MHYNQSCAAKGNYYEGNNARKSAMPGRSMQRAAVNIFKTPESIEMLVFAPGRIREHFHLDLQGDQLKISYFPPEGFPRPDWILREYSRGAFERTFKLDDSIDATNIKAKYIDGVLQVSLPLVPGKAAAEKRNIVVE